MSEPPEQRAQRKARERYLRENGCKHVRVSAAPAQRHLRYLQDYMPMVEIAERAGLSPWTVQTTRDAMFTTHRETAQAILGVHPGPGDTTAAQRKLGARRVYRGLAVRGFTMKFFSAQVGLAYSGFRNVVCDSVDGRAGIYRDGISREKYAELIRVAEKLEMQDPLECGLTKRMIATTKGVAQRERWVDIMAWDLDTVHLEDVKPDITGKCGTPEGWNLHREYGYHMCDACEEAHDGLPKVRGGSRKKVDREKVFGMLDQGLTAKEIAKIMGAKYDTILYIRRDEWEKARSVG